MKTITILGAGVTGLAAGLKLSENYKVNIIEKSKNIGGMSYSFRHKNFILDYGPHKIYTQIPGVLKDISKSTKLLRIKKLNSIYLNENFFDFPVSLKQVALRMPFTAINAGIDIVLKNLDKHEDNSYENYLINRFGRTMYNLVFRDYAWKVWGNPKELDAELAKRRVSVSGIIELIKGILIKKTEKFSADFFYYPIKGSCQLYDDISDKIKGNNGKILLNKKIKEIRVQDKRIKFIKIGNKRIKTDMLVSTIPLHSLLSLIKPSPPKDIIKSSKELEYRDLSIIYFIINKKRALKDNWIFFPEKKFLFNRISEQKSFSEATCPSDKTALMVETMLPATNENIMRIKQQLIMLKILEDDKINEIFAKKLANAYPVYRVGFKDNLDRVLGYLESIENLITIGRHGLFNYNNIDQCWDMASKAASWIKSNGTKNEWKIIKREFDNYKIVD